MTPDSRGARWFVRGDVDGFFGLALDNLIQLLLIVSLCRYVLEFPDDLLFGQVIPAAGLSLLVGNLFYSWQGMQLARREGRDDVCAIPYGINTVSLIVFVFLVMLPVKIASGPRAAWQAGLVAAVGSGLIELLGAFAVDKLRRWVPRAALLSTLAGIALTFIALDFLFRTYQHPIVGLSTFGVVCLVYFGGVRFAGGIPGGLVAVALGAGLCWITGVAGGATPAAPPSLSLPAFVPGDIADAASQIAPYWSVILAMGLFNLFGSLQNLDSAEAAGDRYETTPSLMANGFGTLVGAAFGSCFPTTIYIGHPGWKALGARLGYSWLNGAFMTAVCLTGSVAWIAWAVPIEAGMAIVLWIAIVITAQAFQATPASHAPAVVVGLLPGVAGWGAFMFKQGLRVGDVPFDAGLGKTLAENKIHYEGIFALAEGGIFAAMILAASLVAVIERRLRLAALWCFIGAGLSFVGLVHGWRFTGGDTALEIGWGAAWEAAVGYAAMGVVFLVAPYVGTQRPPGAEPRPPG
jgi:AGZA family xanthine/uracil permease-like MFS transporter